MSPLDDTALSDDEIAQLLIEDAKKITDRAIRRPANKTLRPNTRFLKNLIQNTDGHNAALKRKEERETRERQERLRNEQRQARRRESATEDLEWGRLTPSRDDDRDIDPRASKRRKIKEEHGHREGKSHRTSRREKPLEEESKDEDEEDQKSDRRHGRKSHRHRHRHHHHRDRHDRARSASPSRKHRRRRSRRSRSSSWTRQRRTPDRTEPKSSETRQSRSHDRPQRTGSTRDSITQAPPSRSASTDSASSIGPALPGSSSRPTVRGKGGTANMDKHFAANYNPEEDISSGTEELNGQDDWAPALNAMRDRAEWKKMGAVPTASKNPSSRNKNENTGRPHWPLETVAEDEGLQWRQKGESREWDRGKVVDDSSGDVMTRPVWTNV